MTDEDDQDDGEQGRTEAVAGPSSQRLDKWLWFVRVVKTRTLAAGLVTSGKVRVNRVKTDKPAQALKPGDVVTVAVGPRVRVLRVLASGERRGPPEVARRLYEELTPAPVATKPPAPGTPAAGLVRPAGSGRPTKRERRQIERLRRGDD